MPEVRECCRPGAVDSTQDSAGGAPNHPARGGARGRPCVSSAQVSSPLPLRVGLLGYGWVNREVWEPRLAQHPAARVVARYAPAGVAGAAGPPVQH